jgi:ketol-acid reductoisomerase
MTQVRCFNSSHAAPGALEGERIAILGYGHLGRPIALNLRDSGVKSIIIGNIADDYVATAKADGFDVVSIEQATKGASIVLVMLPDEVIPEVWVETIAPHLAPNTAVVFGSGYTLGYDLIKPAKNLDVLLLAPRMAGENARQRFQEGRGFYAYVSVENDASGKGWKRLLGLADTIGVLKAGAVELSARKEADLDLLVEQTLGATLGVAILSTFDIGIDAGIPPEAMVLEMYMSEEMETVWRAFRTEGFMRASNAHGPTAMYGGFIRTMALLGTDLPGKLRKTFEEIKSGQFATQFQAERKAGYPMLKAAQAMAMGEHPITEAEASLRARLKSSPTDS